MIELALLSCVLVAAVLLLVVVEAEFRIYRRVRGASWTLRGDR